MTLRNMTVLNIIAMAVLSVILVATDVSEGAAVGLLILATVNLVVLVIDYPRPSAPKRPWPPA